MYISPSTTNIQRYKWKTNALQIKSPHTKEHSCPLSKLVPVRPAFYSEHGERMLVLKTKLPPDYIPCGNVEIKTDILQFISYA